jgi:hypothetical protein
MHIEYLLNKPRYNIETKKIEISSLPVDLKKAKKVYFSTAPIVGGDKLFSPGYNKDDPRDRSRYNKFKDTYEERKEKEKIFFKTFSEETGIEILPYKYADNEKIQSQIESGEAVELYLNFTEMLDYDGSDVACLVFKMLSLGVIPFGGPDWFGRAELYCYDHKSKKYFLISACDYDGKRLMSSLFIFLPFMWNEREEYLTEIVETIAKPLKKK